MYVEGRLLYTEGGSSASPQHSDLTPVRGLPVLVYPFWFTQLG